MKPISEKIREMIVSTQPELLKISPEIAGKKKNPGTWSKRKFWAT